MCRSAEVGEGHMMLDTFADEALWIVRNKKTAVGAAVFTK
jgi:hypothetical protein